MTWSSKRIAAWILSLYSTSRFSDFKQSFDVDYGNCYTFNHVTPVKYITKRAGSAYGKLNFTWNSRTHKWIAHSHGRSGLRMTIVSNSSEALPASSEEGVKIVVHSQEITPFPNVEGYRSPIGQAASLQLTRVSLSLKCNAKTEPVRLQSVWKKLSLKS